MSNAWGLKAIIPIDAPHILGIASARTGATDLLAEVWNGSTNAARVFGVQQDGQVYGANGTVLLPTYTFEDDPNSGLYRIGADNIGLTLAGAKVVDYSTTGVAITGTLSVSGGIAAIGTVTSGVWNGTAIVTTYGGTGLTAYSGGDLVYYASGTALSRLGIGSADTVLTSSGSAPQWSTALTLAGALTVAGTSTLGTVNAGATTLTGAFIGTTATLSGALVGVGATFSANLSAVDITSSGVLSGTLTASEIKDYTITKVALGSGSGTRAIDLEDGNAVTCTVATGANTFTFSNAPACGGFVLELTNGGSQTVNWPASVDWPDGVAPSLTSSGVDVLIFLTFDTGTTWRGMLAMRDSQ